MQSIPSEMGREREVVKELANKITLHSPLSYSPSPSFFRTARVLLFIPLPLRGVVPSRSAVMFVFVVSHFALLTQQGVVTGDDTTLLL